MADYLFDEGKNKIEGLKKTEINQALESKADAQAVANAFQSVNEALNGKASTQELNQAVQDINTALNVKANSNDVYTKEQTYSKQQIDENITEIATPIVRELVPPIVNETCYTKTEVDDKIEDIMPTDNAGGEIANFYTSIAAPLIKSVVEVKGNIAGTGEKTPSNPYIITSFIEAVLKHYVNDVSESDIITIPFNADCYIGEITITNKNNGYSSVKIKCLYKKYTIDNNSLTNVGWYAAWNQLSLINVLSNYPAKFDGAVINFVCDKLKEVANYDRSLNVGNYISLISNGASIAVSIPNCDTQTKAVEFITNNSITFCYELATPIEIDLADIESIISFVGENNIFADCGNIEVEYKKSLEDLGNSIEENVNSDIEQITSYVNEKTNRKLEIKTVKLSSSQTPEASTKNLCFVCGKWINKNGEVPDYTGFLFVDEATQKFYYTNNFDQEPQFLFDWDGSIVNNESCKLYAPTITADGDIIFLKDHVRHNPIVYPHGDYAHPYVVDFGSAKKPYAWLVSSSIIQFENGDFCFGDYAYHSLEDEQNDDRRIIWHVTKPYSNPSNWVQAHSFKHVFYTSPQSDEPDNEIGHIHAILYDFYSDDLYCTTGDIDRHCRMWISTDHGVTWAAVPNAVGTTENTTRSAAGQKWRMTNGVFTKDGMYWGTDAERPYHKLWKCLRNLSGHIDFDTLTEVVDLETPSLPNNYSQRTYITALTRDPNGLLLIDRGEPRPDKLDIKFYDFELAELQIIRTFERATTDASSLDQETRIGICQQCTTVYQPQTLLGILTGGGMVIRPNNTSEFNNSKSNYVGTLLLIIN